MVFTERMYKKWIDFFDNKLSDIISNGMTPDELIENINPAINIVYDDVTGIVHLNKFRNDFPNIKRLKRINDISICIKLNHFGNKTHGVRQVYKSRRLIFPIIHFMREYDFTLDEFIDLKNSIKMDDLDFHLSIIRENKNITDTALVTYIKLY